MDYSIIVRPGGLGAKVGWLAARAILGLLVLASHAHAQARETEAQPDTTSQVGDDTSKSGYAESVPAHGGASSVGSDLIGNDTRRDVIFDIDWTQVLFPDAHAAKRDFNRRTGIAFSADYSTLFQRASHSTTDKDAASSVFRFYGNWLAVGKESGASGNMVFKFEHRGGMFGEQAPRDLGFATGSTLSTANYKDSGWGWTDFYWKQVFGGGRALLLLGHMDPGDWADQHSLLNAWIYLLSDAFYNNPAEAIPKRTFSAVTRLTLLGDWYVAGGVHDSNGKDNEIDFAQVWDTPELFTWAEVGAGMDAASFGETTHLHIWHQDERVAAGVEQSWGLTVSSSRVLDSGLTTVLRVGYSEGDAAQMRKFVGAATALPARGADQLIFGAGWGSPPDSSLRDQLTTEVLYRIHFTQNLTMSPDLQVTFDPSFAPDEDIVYVVGLRMRLSL